MPVGNGFFIPYRKSMTIIIMAGDDLNGKAVLFSEGRLFFLKATCVSEKDGLRIRISARHPYL